MSPAARRALTWIAALPLVWGPCLSWALHLDPLAGWAVARNGLFAGLATLLLAWLIVRRTLGPDLRPAAAAACARGLALVITGVAVVRWSIDRSDPIVPYFESFSVLSATLAIGWSAALGVFLTVNPLGRGTPARSSEPLPGVRGLFAVGAGLLGLLAAVLLGVVVSARAAGDVDRARFDDLDRLTDLIATAIDHQPDPDGRRSIMRELTAELYLDGQLLPVGGKPALLDLANAAVELGDRWLLLNADARYQLTRRTTRWGELWLWQPAAASPPVRAPDDAPALLLLAMLMLGAPVGAWLIGHDVVGQLAPIGEALRGMGRMPHYEGGPSSALAAAVVEHQPREVPEASRDEIGDLAFALNTTVRRFAAGNRQLASAVDAAEGSDRARTGFLLSASHELRTPLTTISGYCHLLERTELNEAQREDLAVIGRSTTELLNHVDEILDLSRIEAGSEAPLSFQPVELNALVQQVVDGQGEPDNEVHVSLHLADESLFVEADAQRIRQVVANLFSNALKYTDEGYIDVRVRPDTLDGQPAARVEVVDTGPGIPEDELEAIFVEFHRVAERRAVAGTGLGLSIARRIVDRHRGRLWAESRLGEGSTFHLVLPEARG